MIARRISLRAVGRTTRAPIRSQTRQLASTYQEAAAKGSSSGLVGGLTGGAIVFGLGYGYYHFSGAKSIVNAASSTKAQFNKLAQNLQESAPESSEALKWLRSTTTSYAAFIPGAKSYVDSAFNDLDAVQAKHGKEVDEIVKNAYMELKAASKSGISVETTSQSWEILEKCIKQLGELASDSASEILDNHPQLKDQVGGSLEQLKGMADNYGPEAKEQLDETYQQIKDVIKGGISIESINKVRQLIHEKREQMEQLGDEVWKKGLQQAKPYLDKNPEVKEIVENNADALKQGSFGELLEKVKEAVSSGNTEELLQYAKQAGQKYQKMIPGGGQIFSTIQRLQEVAKDHGKEAEDIVKGAYEEIRDILEKRIAEAESLGEKTRKDVK